MITKNWNVSERIKLDAFLRRELPLLIKANGEVSNSKIRRLIIAGGVSVNSRQVRVPAYDVYPGSTVSVIIQEDKFFYEKKPDDINYVLTDKDVLFEDDVLIVVNKPAFLPTEETIVKGRGNMHQCVVDYLWKKNPSLRNPPYAGIMHRLDRETSGVLLFTKSRSVNAKVSEMFQNHTAHKVYRCVSSFDGKVSMGKKEIVLNETVHAKCFMGRVSVKSQGYKAGNLPASKGGQEAISDFTLVKKADGKYWFDCNLFTGRTHQIRFQISSLGYPILGDELYGGKKGFDDLNGRIMLHAKSLSFPHPVTGEKVIVESPLPPHFQ